MMANELGDAVLRTPAAVARAVEQAFGRLQDAVVRLEGLVGDEAERPALEVTREALTTQVGVLLDRLRAFEPTVIGLGGSAAGTANAADRWASDYRAIIEQVGEAILIADSTARFLEVNTRACALLGRAANDLIGLTVFDIVEPADLRRRPLMHLGLAPSESVLFERRYVRADGTVVPTEVNLTALPDGRLVGVMRDISARQRWMEQQLEQARLDGAHLVARTATHHVNNRLAVVIGYVDEVAALPELTDEARDQLATVQRAARESAAILHRLEGVVRLHEVSHGVGVRPTLDLVRSIDVGG